jgi:PAS domain S-box-containing protein
MDPKDDEEDLLRSVALQNARSILQERQRVERELQAERERLRITLASIGDGVVSTDAEGRVVFLNGVAEALTGWPQTEAAGRPLPEIFHIIDEGTRLPVENPAMRALREGQVVDLANHTLLIARDGTERPIDDSAAPMQDGSGAILGAVLVFRDVTERRRADQELRQRAAELAEADRKKDDFIAMLAHELRNPLAPVLTGLQVMRRSTDPAVVAKAGVMMERQLSHMVRMIDDLLDISRMSRNKLRLQKGRILLADVVNHALEVASPAVAAAGHALHVSLPSEPVVLEADLTRLAQVFGNILANSAKYTQRGGQIWLDAQVQGGAVSISIRDTGIGIPADALGGVFDMFSQVDRSVERVAGGLGIGLALVKALVEAHGGQVTAESPGLGAGSTFTVRLQVADREAAPLAAPPGKIRPVLAGRKVLVADDNEDAAASLAELLEMLGNEVHVAHDGAQALETAERVRPDLVLMDIGMPRADGLTATRRLRERPWARGVTIIALTGWGQNSDRERTRAAGCDDHLVKPVTISQLEKLLDSLP